MSRIHNYEELLAYLNRVEPANGRPIAWAQPRLMEMAKVITYELGGNVPTKGFTITWKNRPKAGGFRPSTLEFEIRHNEAPWPTKLTLNVRVPG